MSSDALSDVLRTFRLAGSMFFRVRLRAPYAVTALGVDQLIERFAPSVHNMLPFHLITRGPIWFDIEGREEPLCLEAGDIIVLPRGTLHSLTDRPGSHPTSVAELLHVVSGEPPTLDWGGKGEPTEALCGFFHCDGRLFNPLINALPEILVIRKDSGRSEWLTATIEHAFSQSGDPRPGNDAMMTRLTELLFLDVIQHHLNEAPGGGWLAGLKDPLVSAALSCFHSQPGHPWTLEALAREVGASRSALTDRFTATIGVSPIRYLTAWRIELAAQRLEDSHDTIGEIAADLGYDSEASFNRAFKRQTGEPPASWRRRHVAASA